MLVQEKMENSGGKLPKNIMDRMAIVDDNDYGGLGKRIHRNLQMEEHMRSLLNCICFLLLNCVVCQLLHVI